MTRQGLTLDAGALIALERNERAVVRMLEVARDHDIEIVVPAGVVAQVWRDGRRQSRLAQFLASEAVAIEPLDDMRARAAGQLCGATGTADVIDASVVLCARSRKHRIVTGAPEDLRRLDAKVELVEI